MPRGAPPSSTKCDENYHRPRYRRSSPRYAGPSRWRWPAGSPTGSCWTAPALLLTSPGLAKQCAADDDFQFRCFAWLSVQDDPRVAYRQMAPALAVQLRERTPMVAPLPFHDDLVTLFDHDGEDGLVGMPREWWHTLGRSAPRTTPRSTSTASPRPASPGWRSFRRPISSRPADRSRT